jgi:hypothetical protein
MTELIRRGKDTISLHGCSVVKAPLLIPQEKKTQLDEVAKIPG